LGLRDRTQAAIFATTYLGDELKDRREEIDL